jgi:hypothetical protein
MAKWQRRGNALLYNLLGKTHALPTLRTTAKSMKDFINISNAFARFLRDVMFRIAIANTYNHNHSQCE